MADQRRRRQSAFRPVLDGQLEARLLLSTTADLRAQRMVAWVSRQSNTAGTVETQKAASDRLRFVHQPKVLVADGGKAVRIQDGRGGLFEARVTAGPGTIKARPRNDGRFDMIVYGTNARSELVVGVVEPARVKGQAHTFNPIYGITNEILAVHDIDVRSGKIGQILGYRTMNLSGTIDLRNDSPVNRIAVNRLMPGATIRTTGDLNTLDVFTDSSLEGEGTGLMIGRDLNWMHVNGNLQITDGAVFETGRDLGLFEQPDKGSAPGGRGLTVEGNITIGPTSTMDIGRFIAGPLVVYGDFGGITRLSAQNLATAPIVVVGDVTP